MKLKITSEVEIDLHSLEYEDWPEEAKKLAKQVISVPRFRKEFEQQLFRKDWLIMKIERLTNLLDEL